MRKKAQGLPLNIVIISILLLIVLAIVVLIFTGRIGEFNKGLEECPSGGRCIETGDCNEGEAKIPLKCRTSEGKKGNFCCVKIGEE